MDNFLLENREPGAVPHLKMIDFGIATTFKDDDKLTMACGTPHFMAPEVLWGRYDQLCDVWSTGIVTATLIVGHYPFEVYDVFGDAVIPQWDTDPMAELFNKIKYEEPKLNDNKGSSPSALAVDYLRGVLTKAAGIRSTAEECLLHPFITVSAQSRFTDVQESVAAVRQPDN
jgi:calcium-dependent protein kinase